MYQYNIGIDIAKDEFVVAIYPNKKTQIYPNHGKGLKVFLKNIKTYSGFDCSRNHRRL